MKKSSAFPSTYMRASDLDDIAGHAITVTVARVVVEELKYDDKVEEKAVIYWAGAKKGMVLNLTNWDMLEQLFGEDSDGWVNQRVILFKDRTNYKGEMKDCMRIRAVGHATPALPAPVTPAAPDEGDGIPF